MGGMCTVWDVAILLLNDQYPRRPVDHLHRYDIAADPVALHLNLGRSQGSLHGNLERNLAVAGEVQRRGKPIHQHRRCGTGSSDLRGQRHPGAESDVAEPELLAKHVHDIAARHRVSAAENGIVHHSHIVGQRRALGHHLETDGGRDRPIDGVRTDRNRPRVKAWRQRAGVERESGPAAGVGRGRQPRAAIAGGGAHRSKRKASLPQVVQRNLHRQRRGALSQTRRNLGRVRLRNRLRSDPHGDGNRLVLRREAGTAGDQRSIVRALRHAGRRRHVYAVRIREPETARGIQAQPAVAVLRAGAPR